MLSETNGKWTTRTTDMMSSKMKVLGRCCYEDRKAHKTTDADFLQRGTMSVSTCKVSSLIQYKKVKIDKLGRWIAQRVSNEKKTTFIIKLCRIPQVTNQGTHTSISQCNQMRGKMKTSTKCRKEMFKEIIYYIKSMKEPVDVMIGGDHDQDIESNETKEFFAELKLQDTHQTFNEIGLMQMDHTHSR